MVEHLTIFFGANHRLQYPLQKALSLAPILPLQTPQNININADENVAIERTYVKLFTFFGSSERNIFDAVSDVLTRDSKK